MFTGKIFVVGTADRRLGLKGSMPLPFVVVHSGKTTITRFGCSTTSVFRSVSFAPGGGYSSGGDKARIMAPKSEMY